jgi:hypothetical protein
VKHGRRNIIQTNPITESVHPEGLYLSCWVRLDGQFQGHHPDNISLFNAIFDWHNREDVGRMDIGFKLDGQSNDFVVGREGYQRRASLGYSLDNLPRNEFFNLIAKIYRGGEWNFYKIALYLNGEKIADKTFWKETIQSNMIFLSQITVLEGHITSPVLVQVARPTIIQGNSVTIDPKKWYKRMKESLKFTQLTTRCSMASKDLSSHVPLVPSSAKIKSNQLKTHKNAGIRLPWENLDGYAGSGSIHYTIPAAHWNTWVEALGKRTNAIMEVWFCPTDDYSPSEDLVHIQVGQTLRVGPSDDKAALTVSNPQKDSSTTSVPWDGTTNIPVGLWNQLCLLPNPSQTQGVQSVVFDVYFNGQYLGATSSSLDLSNAVGSSSDPVAVQLSGGNHVLMEGFSMECDFASAPTAVNVFDRYKTTLGFTSDNKKKSNCTPTLFASSSHGLAFPSVAPVLASLVFPSMTSIQNHNSSLSGKALSSLLWSNPVYGLRGAPYLAYTVSSHGSISSSGIYDQAFFSGKQGNGMLLLHPTSSSNEPEQLTKALGQTEWTLVAWFRIHSYPPQDASFQSLTLLEILPQGSDHDNSNGLSVSFDSEKQQVHALKKEDNSLSMYIQPSCPAGEWFCLAVTRTDKETFQVLINGQPIRQSSTITAHKNGVPSWWGTATPIFRVGNANNPKVPFSADKIAFLGSST